MNPGKKAGIVLPGYDVEKVSEKARKETPVGAFLVSVIFFRIFIGGIADGLLENGAMEPGHYLRRGHLTMMWSIRFTSPMTIWGLSVILNADGTREYKVLGSLAEAVKGTVI